MRFHLRIAAAAWASLVLQQGSPLPAADNEEFKIKRQEVFEFAQKPTLTREGTNVTLSFESKGYCDATVAVENAQGSIVRHLACGVLGPRAPEPFQKNSLKQTILWDGKNDQEEYVRDIDSLSVRVSLGLKPSFEKNLFWEPKRRHGETAPRFQVTPEGVYVYDGGNGRDFVKLYGHDGQYSRTIYPFPGDKVEQVKGLPHKSYPQEGQTLPVKPTAPQQTFLTFGNLAGYEYPKKYAIDAVQSDDDITGQGGHASSFLAVGGGRMALGKTYLGRLATDGTSGGLEMEGPAIALITKIRGQDNIVRKTAIAPRAAALSPDGRTLYLAAYLLHERGVVTVDVRFHCVLKMDLEGDQPPSLFAGNMDLGKPGSDDTSFNEPVSVAVDKAGRVYVADHRNDRVQIFAPDGTFLKSLGVSRPAVVSVAGQSQEIYVCSSYIYSVEAALKKEIVDRQLTVFGRFEDAGKKLSCKLPEAVGLAKADLWPALGGKGFPFNAAVDDFTSPPTLWFANEWQPLDTNYRYNGTNIELYSLEGGQLKPKQSFTAEVARSVFRAKPPPSARSRLYVNPVNGHVFVGEGETFGTKAFKTMLDLDPEMGTIQVRPIPFDCEDMCFGIDGLMYLRSVNMVGRFDSSGREVPWDYGEERDALHTSALNDRKPTAVMSGLPLPANAVWHHGGMYVSPKGNLVVACNLDVKVPTKELKTALVVDTAIDYLPRMYPGRCVIGRGGTPLINIWDKHGKQIGTDVFPGLAANTYGLGLDRDNNVYLLNSISRVIDGKQYHNGFTGTVIKVVPGKARILSEVGAPIPLTPETQPPRPPDLETWAHNKMWVEGAEWMYGGVGFAAPGCNCWHARFTFDYFGRSFAPEVDRFKVAVLDSNGNLILRVGRYGSADSAGAQSLVPLGGDEVGMINGSFLATHTDRRLFIADPMNDRIFSVKLDYHRTEKVQVQTRRP